MYHIRKKESFMFYPKLCCLAISYLKYELEHCVKGSLGTSHGHPVIYVWHNPENPGTTKQHKECHRVSSKAGKELLPKIERYNKLKDRLNEQLNKWYSHYNYTPPLYKVPYKSGRKLNYKYFEDSPENRNPKPPKFPINYKGKTYYSKNEVLAVIVSEQLGLELKSEVPVSINEYTTYILDGLIACKAADLAIFIEIMGMPEKAEYMQKNYQKIVDYSSVGLRQNNEIIYIFVPNSYEFDFVNLANQILLSIEEQLKPPPVWREQL